MNKILSKTRATISGLLIMMVLAGFVAGPAITAAGPSPEELGGHAWSFGVIADSQWTVPDDGYNPNTVAANIIKQVDQQFIKSGVKLVIAVGDTVDRGEPANIETRALYAQDLYNAGIGFYPLRGNHEANEDSTLTSGQKLRYSFPQIGTGVNNNTPAEITTALIPAADLANNPPAKKRGKPFTLGSDFSEPVAVNDANHSDSYSFRYNNATFMLLDQFDVNGNYTNSTIPQQQEWISQALASRPANTQAFLFTHKNILGGNHKDSMFGANIVPANSAAGKDPGDGNGMDLSKLTTSELSALTAKQDAENKFIASMQANKVPLVISAHDHHHYLSLVTSPDGQSKVHQLITQSDGSKFYTPVAPTSANDVPIQQDLGRIGYYIFTVDGPRVTVDYYGDSTGSNDYGLNGGTFDFVKKASFTYNLDGNEKMVAQGAPYALTADTTLAAGTETGFKGTSMSILVGANGSVATTNYGKKFVHDVTTGWAPAQTALASDILSLGGMEKTLGGAKTDEYVLSMSYVPNAANDALVWANRLGLITRDQNGNWVNAVAKNFAVSTSFVLGPYSPNYKLGTYGVDPAAKTAWAVLNYNGEFAVGPVDSEGQNRR